MRKGAAGVGLLFTAVVILFVMQVKIEGTVCVCYGAMRAS